MAKVAKYNAREAEAGDRICMTKGSPVKEGTVRMADEEQCFIVFDDLSMDWVSYGHFYITRKGAELLLPNGQTWFDYSMNGGKL